MLTPDYLLRVSEGAENISESLHVDIVDRIVERMMIRLGRGADYLLTSQDKWQIEVLQDAGYLLEDIQKEISERTKQQEKEIKEAFEEAGVRNISYDDKIYEAAGLSPVPLWEAPHLVRIMQRNYEATLGEWCNFTKTTADASQQAFIRAMDNAYNLATSGAVSYAQAVKEALNDIVANGVEVVYTNPNTGRVHRDTIETATLRAVRTGISQMSGQITDARMEEMNWDIILTSAHLGARIGNGGDNYTNHTWWQGKFYSKSGKDNRFLPYSVCGEGNVQGIHGANCRHSHGPGDGENNPFEGIDSEENRRIRGLEERQRLLERRIRKTKREVMGLKTSVDNAQDAKLKFELDLAYQRKSALLQKQNKEYTDFCKKNGLKKLNERIQIAKWDRQEAATARGAAKRYNNALEITKRQGIIKQRISAGEYSLKLSQQQYLKHFEGTKQFEDYMGARTLKGQTPQGKLFLSEDEAQSFIDRLSGSGVPKVNRKGEVLQIEFVSDENVVGQYYKNGEWNDTKRAAIHYGKKASHIVPVEEKND